MTQIDPLAVVSSEAILGDNVSVGPWSYIGPGVRLGDDCTIESHVVIKGPTTLGRNNHVFQFSSIGESPPDRKYDGEPTTLVVGDDNVFREGVTIHRGTVQDRGETTIGSNNLFMAYSHVGHDSVIGNDVIFVNNSAVAGHVVVEDWAILAGYSLVHQWCRIGAHSFCAFGSVINQDVPAYLTVNGSPASPKGINKEGLSRRGFDREQLAVLLRCYKLLYRRGLRAAEAIEAIESCEDYKAHKSIIDPFIRSIQISKRGVVR